MPFAATLRLRLPDDVNVTPRPVQTKTGATWGTCRAIGIAAGLSRSRHESPGKAQGGKLLYGYILASQDCRAIARPAFLRPEKGLRAVLDPSDAGFPLEQSAAFQLAPDGCGLAAPDISRRPRAAPILPAVVSCFHASFMATMGGADPMLGRDGHRPDDPAIPVRRHG